MTSSNTKTAFLGVASYLSDFTATELSTFNTQEIGLLSNSQVTSLTLSQWTAFTPAQLAHLTSEHIETLVKANIEMLAALIQPTTGQGWSTDQFSALSLDVLEAIPPKLLAESLGPALSSMAGFSNRICEGL